MLSDKQVQLIKGCKEGRYKDVKHLLGEGLNPNFVDDDLVTPLIYAERYGWAEISRLLKRHLAKYFHHKTLKKMKEQQEGI